MKTGKNPVACESIIVQSDRMARRQDLLLHPCKTAQRPCASAQSQSGFPCKRGPDKKSCRGHIPFLHAVHKNPKFEDSYAKSQQPQQATCKHNTKISYPPKVGSHCVWADASSPGKNEEVVSSSVMIKEPSFLPLLKTLRFAVLRCISFNDVNSTVRMKNPAKRSKVFSTKQQHLPVEAPYPGDTYQGSNFVKAHELGESKKPQSDRQGRGRCSNFI